MEGFVVILAVILVAVFVAVLDWQGRRRREKELSAWAAGRGLRFNPEREPQFGTRYESFRALQRGSNRYAFNRITGSWGTHEFTGFDYHFETYSYGKHGRTTHHHYFSAVILSSPVPLTPLVIRPEGMFDKVAEFFGLDDIDFESAEFSRCFHVSSPDRKWAYDVLHARAIQHMLEMPVFTIEFGPREIIASRSKRFTPADFDAASELVARLLDGLPDYVLRERNAPPRPPPPLPGGWPERRA